MIATYFRTSLFAVACPMLLAGKCGGELVTFRFEGKVLNVDAFSIGLDYPRPAIGATIRGTYSFDSNAVDTANDPLFRGYASLAPAGARVNVGEFSLVGVGTDILVYDSYFPIADNYAAFSRTEFQSHPDLNSVFTENYFELSIRGGSDLLDGLALPLTPPSLATARFAGVLVRLDNETNFTGRPYVYIVGTLESLTLVPEPAYLVPVTIAACVLYRVRWRTWSFSTR
jgi:hypothetical protein